MKLFEAKQILKKNGYRLVEDKYTDIMDVEDDYSETNDIITVDHIDKDNYEDYIGKTVNVKGDVYLKGLGLTKLPIRFIKVGGHFDCFWNKLTSLEGAPKEVGGWFDCSNNQLTDLKGAPRKVGCDFYCQYNKLTNLEGAPEKVGDRFYGYKNKIQFTEKDVRDYCNVNGEIYL